MVANISSLSEGYPFTYEETNVIENSQNITSCLPLHRPLTLGAMTPKTSRPEASRCALRASSSSPGESANGPFAC